MVQLIKIEIDKIQNMSNILSFIKSYYGFGKSVEIYLTNDGNNNGMVTRFGDECIYLVGDRKFNTYKFYLNESFELSTLLKDGCQIEFGYDIPTLKKDNNTLSMFFSYDGEKDLEGYDGRVIFNQYDEENDINCEIQFPHMYRGCDNSINPPVYEMHLKSFRTCYIDSCYRKKGEVEFGFIRKGSEYYNKFIITKGDPDYEVICFKDGLKSIEQPFKLTRYCKTKYITSSGDYITGFPFCKLFTEQDVRKRIEELGFVSDVPELLLRVYNGKDSIVNDIISLVEQMKMVEDKKEDCMRINLELHEY